MRSGNSVAAISAKRQVATHAVAGNADLAPVGSVVLVDEGNHRGGIDAATGIRIAVVQHIHERLHRFVVIVEQAVGVDVQDTDHAVI